ncbi:glycosyltransferase family 4 protein [Dolosigranulum pigrum]|uniref:glycosyltransferase family 4 protein n=1 Tax=Dolosigranulum pigrum TaxID=29394 RepID=UPI001AD85901|nr:glycosyltransferase family 4 protein [Dolosigranulum pigrum]QTJ57162.1 glycosyltransferase family 4 protein [Dolosigranulum pigrum]
MKILMTTDLYKPTINGVVTSIETLKEALEAQGHDVRVLTLDHDSEINMESHVLSTSSFNINKIYPGARFTLSTNNDIYTDILRWQPDIIHSHCEFSTFRMAKTFARKLNIPIIHTYHTVYEDYTHYFSPNRKWGKKLVSVFSKYILKHAEMVVAPTEKVKQLLESYEVDQPIQVVPTGISTEKFNYTLSNSEYAALKEQYNIAPDDRIILFLGRVAKEKNLDEVIRYLADIKPDQTTFLICGDGPHTQELKALVESLGVQDLVKFAGMIDPADVPKYYQLADIFTSASTSETQGLTYIEALLSGTPLLCRYDTCLEGVLYPGVNGYAYTEFDEFRQHLTTLLNHRQNLSNMGVKARQLAIEDFSAEKFAEKISLIYRQAIKLNIMTQQLNPHTSQLSKVVDTIKVWV